MTHDPQVVQYNAPATLATVVCNNGFGNLFLLLDPLATIAVCTVNLPSTPSDGQMVVVASSQIITALTIANGTIIGTLTTLALGAYAHFMYSSTASKWFRVG